MGPDLHIAFGPVVPALAVERAVATMGIALWAIALVCLPLTTEAGLVLWGGLVIGHLLGANALLVRTKYRGWVPMLFLGELCGGITLVAAGTGGLASAAAPWLASIAVTGVVLGGGRHTIALCLGWVAFTLALWLWQDPGRTSEAISVAALSLWLCGAAVGVTVVCSRLLDQGKARAQMWSQLMDRAGEAILVVDGDGRVRAVNRFGVDTLRLEAKQIRGRLLSSFIQEVAPDQLLGGTARVRRTDGTTFLAEIKRGLACDAGFSVLVISDVSELDQTRLALNEARGLALRAGQARRQFLRVAGHELRTPLTSVLGFARILEVDRDLLPQSSAVAVEQVLIGARQLELLFDALATIGSSEQLVAEPQPCDLGTCLQLAAQRSGWAGRSVKLDVPSDLPMVHADQSTLVDALARLMAHRASAEQVGEVMARRGREGVWIHLKEHVATATASDPMGFGEIDGGAFSEAAIGLGLRAAEAMIAALGSELRVATEAGHSNTFSFVLPVYGVSHGA